MSGDNKRALIVGTVQLTLEDGSEARIGVDAYRAADRVDLILAGLRQDDASRAGEIVALTCSEALLLARLLTLATERSPLGPPLGELGEQVRVPAVCMPVTVLASGPKRLTVEIDPDRATAIRLENDTPDARDVKVTLELEPPPAAWDERRAMVGTPGVLEREAIVHRGDTIVVPNQEMADAVTFTSSKAGGK